MSHSYRKHQIISQPGKKSSQLKLTNSFFGHLRHFQYLSIIVALSLFFLLVPIYSQKIPYLGKTVSQISFYGLNNVSVDELYELLTSRYDQPLTEQAVNDDVRQLFATGYFNNVTMRVKLRDDDTVALIYELKELPQIDQITYIGLKELSNQDFIRKVGLGEDDFFSIQKVEDSITAIKEICIEKGFFQAEVWYRLSEVDTDTNTIQVYFIIDEGNHIPISKINIVGTNYLDTDIIISIIQQKEGLDPTDAPFRKSTFEEDKFRILSYAKSQGLLNAQFDPQLTGYRIRWRNPNKPEDGRVVVVTYALIEGSLQYFGGYSMEHVGKYINQELNPKERIVKDKSQLKPIYLIKTLLNLLELSNDNLGKRFDENRYFKDRGAIQEAYARRGYIFAQVQPELINFSLEEKTLKSYENCLRLKKPKTREQTDCKKKAEWLDLTALRKHLEKNPKNKALPFRHIHFRIYENNLAYVENIIIRGNDKTQEDVIRREILIKEGQLFNSTLVSLSRQKLINLQYFSEVNLQMRPGSDRSKMNIVFEVKEQPTGNITLGGTYSITSGFAIRAGLAENNFRGTGTRLSGEIDYGPNQRQVSLGWDEPWFYERCRGISTSFWRSTQLSFDSARNRNEIFALALDLQNDHENLGKAIIAYVDRFQGDNSIVSLDRIKLHVRRLLSKRVIKEESCFRSFPSPWSLGVDIFIRSQDIPISAIRVASNAPTETAYYQSNSYGLSFNTSHRLSNKWSHYHSYIPQWRDTKNPTALASDIYFLRASQGLQFRSSLRNGLVYSDIDNVFSPTEGYRNKMEAELVGSYLGGNDHFNRYILSGSYYFWWTDFTFGNLFRNKALRLWRIVQEFTYSSTFTQETAPAYKNQDKEVNPFIDNTQKLFLGGPGNRRYGRLRGYGVGYSGYPTDWRLGSHHMLLFGTELRIPIEPRFLWLVAFFDAGSLYNTIGDFTREQKDRLNDYDNQAAVDCAVVNSQPDVRRHYSSCEDWNDPTRTQLALRNVALDRFLYSWGYGLRIQIPVLPLRIYYAQKLYYDGNLKWRPIPGDDGYELVFAISDYRF